MGTRNEGSGVLVKYKGWFLISLVLVFFNGMSYAQNPDIKFKTYSTKHGLAQSSVIAILQDDEGFMWFGTYGGLSRFDGYNVQTFLNDKSDPNSLSDNHVRAICQDTAGFLFVATVNGLNRLNTSTGKFIRFEHDSTNEHSISGNQVYDIIKDRDGDIWVATWAGGLNKMERIGKDYKDGEEAEYKFIRFKHQPGKNSISSNDLPDLHEGPDGNIWIASRNGLNKYDKKNGQFTVFQYEPNNPNSISNNNVSSICFDLDGNAWAGTWEGGLNRINLKTGKITRFKNVPLDPKSLSHDIIMSLFCDKDGNVWVGTWGGGLNKVVVKREQKANGLIDEKIEFLRYQYNKIDFSSVGSNSIYSFCQDKTGIIWVGTDWGGVSKFNASKNKFRHIYAEQSTHNSLVNNVVLAFQTDKDGYIWIGTHEGLCKYDRKNNKFKTFKKIPGNPNSISDNQVRNVIQTKDNTIWLGTAQGLNKYSPSTNSFKSYYIDPNEKGGTCIMKLYESSNGHIWIGTFNYGIYRFDPVNEIFEKVIPKTKSVVTNPNDIIWSIIEDKKRNLWLGMVHGGLFSYNLDTEKFISYPHDPNDSTSISDNDIKSLYIDSNENLWVGTANGLNRLTYDKGSGKPIFLRYNKKDGLSDQLINGIIEDNNGVLWVTSSKGLNMFDPKRGLYKTYTREDGVQDDEFSINALMKDEETGEIYAGGINGFNIFNPDEMVLEGSAPIVKNIELKIHNKPVKVGEEINKRVLLERKLNKTKKIELSYMENYLSIEYAALHYLSPESNQYAYMLEGFDNDWIYIGNQRVATYTNLPTGKYVFKVKAANPDGVWCKKPTELVIYIKPPWWGTTLFKVIVSLTVLLIVFSTYRLRIRFIKRREIELKKIVKTRTDELTKANELLEERQVEISKQNKELLSNRKDLQELNSELLHHKDNLEKKVEERTKELKDAKIRAEESDRLKSAFLANMSHEVRTPMNAIIGFSNLLEDEGLTEDEKARFVKLIQNNGDTLLTLIDDILDISIIEANQLKLVNEIFPIEDVVNEVYSYFSLKNEKEIEIELVISDTAAKPYVLSDRVRFRQIMNNLMNNAFKYTKSGKISLGCIINDGYVEIFVEDTGIGISEKDIGGIFDYFHKVEEDNTRLYRGAGIGLSICKKLVSLMGSKIEVASEVGQGSRFFFKLPVIQKEVESKAFVNYQTNRAQKLKDLEIIVAEDEQNNFELINKILTKNGAKIYWAKNGQEAIELTKKLQEKSHSFIVLMDIKMPVMNGIEALQKIKNMDKDIPIIAVTAYALAIEKSKIMSYEFDDYIAKPLNPDSLIQTISHLSAS